MIQDQLFPQGEAARVAREGDVWRRGGVKRTVLAVEEGRTMQWITVREELPPPRRHAIRTTDSRVIHASETAWRKWARHAQREAQA